MSDIADNGSFNLGLANIASQNYGPSAISNQNLQGAQTQNIQQQAQASAMQNKLMAARMPLILSQLHDESVGAGDQSGVGGEADNQGNPTGGASSGGSNGVGGVGGTPRTPGEDIASEDQSAVAPNQNFYQPDKIGA